MSYIFKQKLDLRELAAFEKARKRILLYQPQADLGALYSHYLKFHNFDVKHCQDIAALKEHMQSFMPEVIFYSIEGAKPLTVLSSLRSLKKNLPATLVVTTGFNTDAETLKQLLSAGVSSHINRCHSRPEDIVAITKTLLNY